MKEKLQEEGKKIFVTKRNNMPRGLKNRDHIILGQHELPFNRKALQFHQSDDFVASRGWLGKVPGTNCVFPKKKDNSVRGYLKSDHQSIHRVGRMWMIYQFPPSSIGNMDETPLWLDMPGDATVSSWKRSVSIHTTP